jgi:hypothetical protein
MRNDLPDCTASSTRQSALKASGPVLLLTAASVPYHRLTPICLCCAAARCCGWSLHAAGALNPKPSQPEKIAPVYCAAGFAVLRVAGCARLGRHGLSQLAAVGAFSRLRELDVSHLDGLWAKPVSILSVFSLQLRNCNTTL